MPLTSITVRVDDDFKERVERAADAADMSVTEYTTRALKLAMDVQCPECGRSSGASTMPVAFTPAFEEWVARTSASADPFFLTTAENGARVVYWARHRDDIQRGPGALPVRLFTGDVADEKPEKTVPMSIPAGIITAWGADSNDGREYARLLAHGYRDGNDAARRTLRYGLPL